MPIASKEIKAVSINSVPVTGKRAVTDRERMVISITLEPTSKNAEWGPPGPNFQVYGYRGIGSRVQSARQVAMTQAAAANPQ